MLSEYIQAKGFDIDLGRNGDEGFTLFAKNKYDLCLLDIMMPIKDGISLAKEIRRVNKEIPIMFLTAKSMKEDTIEGFKAGADDYITKPFSMEELLMRIQAILRRTAGLDTTKKEPTQFKLGGFDFDYNQQKLSIGEDTQKLTSKENELLKLLCLSQDDVLDRSYALKSIWEDDNYFNSRSMDVYIAKLRKYLKKDSALEIINVHGKGFKLLTKV